MNSERAAVWGPPPLQFDDRIFLCFEMQLQISIIAKLVDDSQPRAIRNMNLDKLTTKKNLILAWQRITSSSDARYKAFFRHILEAYELSSEKNIDDLIRRLKMGEYVAQTPVRFYVPKSSGLQRPLTLLSIEDQILFQALANLFAERVRKRRNKLAGKYIYSNNLGKKDSRFFLEKWQLGFSQLKRRLKSKFKDGYVWIATFDISAFYDTIPHEILLKVLIPQGKGVILICRMT